MDRVTRRGLVGVVSVVRWRFVEGSLNAHINLSYRTTFLGLLTTCRPQAAFGYTAIHIRKQTTEKRIAYLLGRRIAFLRARHRNISYDAPTT